MKTKITEMLGIEYPVLMGGLQWISRAEFVSAISNAGGLSFLTAATHPNKQAFVDEIRKCRALTKKPFGVNISMLPELAPAELTMKFVEAAIEEKIQVVETSGRDPAPLIGPLKRAGIKVIHKVTSPKHAKSAEKAGVDAVVVLGYEGAGHPGMDQVGTFVNLPKAVSAVNIPVIAAGGVCDGASLAAALILGAEAVLMGTRFIATKECPVHDNLKNRILDADITDTVIIQRSIRNAFRAIKNEKALTVLELEQAGARIEDLLPHISGKLGLEAMTNGDIDKAVISLGQCAGRIDSITSVFELIPAMVSDAEMRIKNLAARTG
ncbi:MAG: nitronate monooxygenase [Clostridiales Family XIII bacterium]|jgi:nitronate monooxygenase|nr:nitronate monooxygenase [Clostridiales Family XIII bacterium]